MGLAVAVGSKTASSRGIEIAAPVEEYTEDLSLVVPVPCQDGKASPVLVTTALSADQALQCILTVSFYDMVREEDDEFDCTIASMQVQILPSTENLSSSFSKYRECHHRIRLPPSPRLDKSSTLMSAEPIDLQVVFSNDRRFLSCLVPYPTCSETALVVFQLRQPRAPPSSQRQPPPLPSYISSTTQNNLQPQEKLLDRNGPMPVATNPRLIQDIDHWSLVAQRICCIADVSSAPVTVTDQTNSNYPYEVSVRPPSILLAGCQDGTILAFSYRPLSIAGSFFTPQMWSAVDIKDQQSPAQSIRALSHITEWFDGSNGTTGSLMVQQGDGSVSIFSTQMICRQDEEPSESSAFGDWSERSTTSSRHGNNQRESIFFRTRATSFYFVMEPSKRMPGPFSCVEWISGSYLATLPGDMGERQVDVHVWGLHGETPVVLFKWNMAWDRLRESAHTTFNIEVPEKLIANEDGPAETHPTTCLRYDPVCDCLCLSAALFKTDRKASSNSNGPLTGPTRLWWPFVAVWNWRNNVEGLIVALNEPTTCSAFASTFSICINAFNKRMLVHNVVSADGNGSPFVQKEVYDSAVLSASAHRCPRGSSRSNSLLVGPKSISFPFVRSHSPIDSFEIEWRETKIPVDYVKSYGSPCMAAIGSRLGRSVAVASSRGLCSLDCGEAFGEASSSGRAQVLPRWYRLGNETEESQLKVISFGWWEGPNPGEEDTMNVLDDILIALIEIDEGPTSGFYLSCWAQKRLDFDHQLLRCEGEFKTGFGARLADDFHPSKIDILADVSGCAGDSSRKAVILITDKSVETSFVVYQLQVVSGEGTRPRSYKELLPFYVVATQASTNTIGDPAELFLAGAYFGFDLCKEMADFEFTAEYYVATIGIIRTSGQGVDAISLVGSSIGGVGQVIHHARDRCDSEVARYWLADFVKERPLNTEKHSFALDSLVWIFQTVSGALITWSVPLPYAPGDVEILLENPPTNDESRKLFSLPVHGTSMVLGFRASAGKTSLWMQQPAMGARKVYPVGSVPRSPFGCVLGAGQDCRKIHRSLGEDFEQQLFRPDFLEHELLRPGDFEIALPTYIPSLYSFGMDMSTANGDRCTCSLSLHEHIMRSTTSALYSDSALTSLQLLILRVVERIAGLVGGGEKLSASCALTKNVFSSLVDALKKSLSPLQFAAFFLDVARQIEPSFAAFIFPIPGSTGSRGESADDLCNLALKHGSISIAVSSLPLHNDGIIMQASCAAIFHHCLYGIGRAFEEPSESSFDFVLEERATVRDIFRYALKLEDCTSPSVRNDHASVHSVDSDGSIDGDSGSRRGFTLMCGLSRFFSRRKEESDVGKAAASFISGGFTDNGNDKKYLNGGYGMIDLADDTDSHTEVIEWVEAQGVAGMTARYLLSTVFHSNSVVEDSGWKRASAMATLLLGDGSTGLHVCSTRQFSAFIRRTKSGAVDTLLKSCGHKRGELVKFLVHGIRQCNRDIGYSQSSLLLELILVILARHGDAEDLSTEAPGLLIVALVVGHASGRIADYLEESTVDHAMIRSYYDAVFELDNDSTR